MSPIKRPIRKRLSLAIFERVMLSPIKQYQFARKIGAHPSILNKAIHGWPVSTADRRWTKLAKLVGLPESETFTQES